MNNVFFIFGYGIPKNMLTDENYAVYLKLAFNAIYTAVTKENVSKPYIILSGGHTDCFKPYRRTEADEMIKFLHALIQNKPALRSITKKWRFIPERNSLSGLENLLLGKKLIEKRKIEGARVTIFCEQTREKRMKTLAKKVFGTRYAVHLIPIDFDVSANRYISPEFIEKKEKQELQDALWTLKSPKNLKKYHQMFEKKIHYLRKAGPKAHGETVRKLWKERVGE